MLERVSAWERTISYRPCGYTNYSTSDRRTLPLSGRASTIVPQVQQQIASQTQQKLYRAYFRGVDQTERESFKNEKCFVPISIGPRYHDGERFDAVLQLVSQSFKECEILISDTLHRYSLAATHPNKTEQELHDLSVECGKQWLERNKASIARLTVPHTISTWDQWLNHPDRPLYAQAVARLYETDLEYRTAVDTVVDEFIERSEERRLRYGDVRNASLKYILEESTVACLWIKAGNVFELYPTGDNLPMLMAHERLLHTAGLKYRSLSVNIRKRNQKS